MLLNRGLNHGFHQPLALELTGVNEELSDSDACGMFVPWGCDLANIDENGLFTIERQGRLRGFLYNEGDDTIASGVPDFKEWTPTMFGVPDLTAYPCTLTESNGAGAARTGALAGEHNFMSRTVRPVVADYAYNYMMPAPDMRCGNHFTDAYEDRNPTGEVYTGPIYFTEMNGSVTESQADDYWDAHSVDGARTLQVLGRDVMDTTTKSKYGASVPSWRPCFRISAATLVHFLTLEAALDAMQDRINELGDAYNALWYDCNVAGGIIVTSIEWPGGYASGPNNALGGGDTVLVPTATVDDVPKIN